MTIADMTINDFLHLDLRQGHVVDVLICPGSKGIADKYAIHIDFGADVGRRWADLPSGQLYEEAWLLGSSVFCLVNRGFGAPRGTESKAVVVLGLHAWKSRGPRPAVRAVRRVGPAARVSNMVH
jgi:hypothetical protein